MDDVYTDFFDAHAHLLKALHKYKADPKTIIFCLDHLIKLRVLKGKIKLNTLVGFNHDSLEKLFGEQVTPPSPPIEIMILTDKHSKLDGCMHSYLSDVFVQGYIESQKTAPTIIVKNAPAPIPPPPPQTAESKKSWDYANELFGESKRNDDGVLIWTRRGYTNVDGNKVAMKLLNDRIDLKSFSEWRKKNNRLPLEVSESAVLKEFAIFQKPPKIVKFLEANPPPVYRKAKGMKKDD